MLRKGSEIVAECCEEILFQLSPIHGERLQSSLRRKCRPFRRNIDSRSLRGISVFIPPVAEGMERLPFSEVDHRFAYSDSTLAPRAVTCIPCSHGFHSLLALRKNPE